MSVSKEAIEAGLRITLSSVNMPAGECLHETDVREILEAALPFLPIAGEGKVKGLTKTQIETLANNIHNSDDYAYTIECLTYHLSAPSSPGKDGGQEVEAVTCERCQGNGEIVTDWERYKHPHEGDAGDEAVAECPDCNGEGRIDTQPDSTALVERLREAVHLLEEVKNAGLIYWEPNTDRGHVAKAMMIRRIDDFALSVEGWR